jgi:hypothetical protein
VEEAWAARCAGSVPIGATVTDAEGRIDARGRNHIGEGCGDARCLYDHPFAHTEVIALVALFAEWHFSNRGGPGERRRHGVSGDPGGKQGRVLSAVVDKDRDAAKELVAVMKTCLLKTRSDRPSAWTSRPRMREGPSASEVWASPPN